MGRLVLVIALVACGGDDDAALDGGMEGDGGSALTRELPTAPAPPLLTLDGGCEGWAQVDVGDGLPTLCEPYPDGQRACERHEAHFPGEDACRSPGRACSTGFPSAPAGGNAVYVELGASGDGSEASPFGTLGDALAAVPSGGFVLIGPGTYSEENLVARRSVTIRGACVAETRIAAPTLDESGWILRAVEGATLRVEDLQMTGPRTAVVVDAGASAEMRGVALIDLHDAGVVTFGTTLIEDAVVRHTDPDARGNFNVGVAAYDDASLTVRDTVIRGHIDLNAQVRGATATFEGVVFGKHFETFERTGGRGLEAARAADVTVRRSVFAASSESAALAADVGTVLIIDGARFSGHADGAALAAIDSAELRATRVNVSDSLAGIVVSRGASLAASDVVISGSGGDVGVGIEVMDDGTSAQLERVLVVAAPTSGVATTTGAQSTLTDVRILDGAFGRELAVGQYAFGLVFDESSGTLERIALDDNLGFGILAVDARLDGRDVAVANTAALPITGIGSALRAQESQVTLERVLLEGNLGSGLVTLGESSDVVITHLTARETLRGGCLDAECASFIGGVGVGAYGGAQLMVRTFIIADNDLLGAQVGYGLGSDGERASGGELTLLDGTIARNPFAINVQIPDYDYDRFQNIDFVDNERTFDSTIMGVPRPPDF